MISAVNPTENLIAARLLDYFSTRTHWHRTLWNAGTILALGEILEASEAQNHSGYYICRVERPETYTGHVLFGARAPFPSESPSTEGLLICTLPLLS